MGTMRPKPLLRNQRFHDWAMVHPVRGSLVVGAAFTAVTSVAMAFLGGLASLSVGTGVGLASVLTPFSFVVGVLMFGPAIVFVTRRQERRSGQV